MVRAVRMCEKKDCNSQKMLASKFFLQEENKKCDTTFKQGDLVQLTDQKNRLYTIILAKGESFQSISGIIKHDEIIGIQPGSVIRSNIGKIFLAMRPALSDYVLSMPRGATIIYPKDAAMIVQLGDIFPGATVLEAGVGSGALTLSLINAIGDRGKLISFEKREDFAKIALGNVKVWHKGNIPINWDLEIGDFSAESFRKIKPHSVDRIVLDMLDPWENLSAAYNALKYGGMLICYVTTASQLSRLDDELKANGLFTKINSFETFMRNWHVKDLSVRPEHSMIGHTGFILTTRTICTSDFVDFSDEHVNNVPELCDNNFIQEKNILSDEKTHSVGESNILKENAGKWSKISNWEKSQGEKSIISDKKIRKIIRDLDKKIDKVSFLKEEKK